MVRAPLLSVSSALLPVISSALLPVSGKQRKTTMTSTSAGQGSLSPLPVEDKQIMGTWGALGIPFPSCQSRKRRSWEHGHALAIPFSLACRGNGYHGIVACACDSLFPLPVEEKAIVGWLRFAFPPASRGKGFDRTQQSKATSSNDTPRARQVP